MPRSTSRLEAVEKICLSWHVGDADHQHLLEAGGAAQTVIRVLTVLVSGNTAGTKALRPSAMPRWRPCRTHWLLRYDQNSGLGSGTLSVEGVGAGRSAGSLCHRLA